MVLSAHVVVTFNGEPTKFCAIFPSRTSLKKKKKKQCLETSKKEI